MTANSASAPFFEIENLRQTLGGHVILRGVSLVVPTGKTTVVLGGSGAGKSVLLKHLNGLIRPLSGTIKVKGLEISDLTEREMTGIRRTIGVLFQDGALFDSMTVGENIAFPQREAGERDEVKIQHRVAEVLTLVGLSGQEGKMPATLSGGMRKRVSLARAISIKPECLLYDEPTAGLDPILSESITRLISTMKEELKVTSVVVTHNMGAMRLLADQVIFLKDGAVHYAGTPAGLEESEDESIRDFISADAMGRG